MLFYRFISENLTGYLNEQKRRAGDPDFDYARLSDTDAAFGRAETVREKGFYILPSELFANVRARARLDPNLNETLSRIFVDGDAYEYLMQMYASTAGKSGGEFYTPQEVSEQLARLTVVGKTEVNKVYDPACGSGSLLLKFAKVLGEDKVRQGFYGQEVNLTTYNLCRINMFLHDINYEKFDIAHGDTLTEAQQRKILDAFTARNNIDHFARLVDNDEIATNGYNIAASSYVEQEDTREAVDITALNAEITRIVARQAKLRTQIDAIVADLEGRRP